MDKFAIIQTQKIQVADRGNAIEIAKENYGCSVLNHLLLFSCW